MDNIYKILNGTYYNSTTPDNVIKELEKARKGNYRIRIWYGDTKTGKDWLEINDIIGYVGRTTGPIKVPILLKKNNSTGGTAILDHCIIKITVDKKIVYQNPNYYLPKMEIKELPDRIIEASGLKYGVYAQGLNIANKKTKKEAENEILFHKGLRNKIA